MQIVEILWYIFEALFVIAFYAAIYVILCVPGLILSRFVRKASGDTPVLQAFARATVRAVFFAPTVILGHSPVVVPVLLGVLASYYDIGSKLGPAWLFGPALVVFVASLAHSLVQSNFALTKKTK